MEQGAVVALEEERQFAEVALAHLLHDGLIAEVGHSIEVYRLSRLRLLHWFRVSGI